MIYSINCDLGEGEPPDLTIQLLNHVSLANIACGGHAGSADSMSLTIRLAQQAQVRIGAHPGWPDTSSFGRTPITPTPTELQHTVIQQITTLHQIAQNHGAALHHVKLHGALYHATESSEALAQAFLQSVHQAFPHLAVIAKAQGRVASIAHELKIPVLNEAFLDRGYDRHGALLPRSHPHALITKPAAVANRLQTFLDRHEFLADSGHPIPLKPDTFCIHSDSPNAVEIARTAREWLDPQSQMQQQEPTRSDE